MYYRDTVSIYPIHSQKLKAKRSLSVNHDAEFQSHLTRYPQLISSGIFKVITIGNPASMAGRKRVFDSVFPSSRLKDLAPTPAATPVLGQTEFVQSFGGPAFSHTSYSPSEASDLYPEQIIWDRAWHSVTSFLALPQRDFVERLQQQDLNAFTTRYNKASKNVIESFRYVASKLQERPVREKKVDHENVVEWYTDHVRGHFLAYAKPSLSRVSST